MKQLIHVRASYVKLFVFAFVLLSFTTSLYAANAKEYKDHIIYHNAFPTDSLPPEMTKQYGLKRSKNYAMVNISVMKRASGVPIGVKAKVTGTLTNLMGQTRKLEFREIKEADAVYYIAQIGVQSREVVNFYIDIRPEGTNLKYDVAFSKKF
jgi:hypothetical protein